MEYDLYVMYSNFSLHDSLENAVSEHLEWLKLKKKTHRGRGLQCPPPDPPIVSCTACNVAFDLFEVSQMSTKVSCRPM